MGPPRRTAYRAAGDAHRATAVWLDPSLVYVRRPPIDLDDLRPDAAARLAADAAALARAGDTDEAWEVAMRALAIAEEQHDSAAGGAAALALLLAGHPADAVAHLESLRLAAIVADDPVQEARRSFDLARSASAVGDQASAEAHQRAGLGAMARVPESGERPVSQAGLAALLATSGRLADAEALAGPLLDDPNVAVSTVAGLPLTIVDLAHGRLDRARSWLAAIAPYRAIAGPDLFGVVMAQEALLHLRGGDLDRAAAVLDDAEAWIGGRFDISRIDRLEISLRVAVLRGDDRALDRLVGETRQLAEAPCAGPGGHGIAALAAGLRESGAAPTPSPSPTSRRPPASSPPARGSSRRPMHGATPRWRRWRPATTDGRAPRWMPRWRWAGVRPPPRPGGSHRGLVGLGAGDRQRASRLTPRERSVIRLVASGLTNKEIGPSSTCRTRRCATSCPCCSPSSGSSAVARRPRSWSVTA